MKIKFNNDENLRKLVMIHQLFGPPESPARRLSEYSPLISKEFDIVSQIYQKYINNHKTGERGAKFWADCLNEKMDSKLLQLLEKIDAPLPCEKYYEKIEKSLTVTAKERKAMEYWIKKTFGKKLPKEVTVVPFPMYRAHGSSGTMLLEKPATIGISRGYFAEKEGLQGTFLHELLHALVKDNLSKKGKGKFEEALLDYFVPDGILAEKVGIIKKLDFEKLKRQNAWRTSSAEESKKLEQTIKEYCKICGKKTIWQFLRKRGFGEYLS